MKSKGFGRAGKWALRTQTQMKCKEIFRNAKASPFVFFFNYCVASLCGDHNQAIKSSRVLPGTIFKNWYMHLRTMFNMLFIFVLF